MTTTSQVTITIIIQEYSPKSFVVRGDTKPFKDELKNMGGRWNTHLTVGAGWIFSNEHKSKVEQPNFETQNSEWDDSAKNNGKVGAIFAFVQNGEDVAELFYVQRIKPANQRRPEWNLDHHRDRQVLVLSKIKERTTWTDLKRRLEYSENFKLQGTMRSTKHRKTTIRN